MNWWVGTVGELSNRHTTVDDGTRGRTNAVIIGSVVGCTTHGDEHANQVEPDSKIGNPTELLEGTNLTNEETNNGPDQTADNKAEFELGDLRQSLSVGDDNQTNVENKLDTLQDVDQVAHPGTKETETEVTKVTNGVVEGVKTQEHVPKQVTRINGETGEDGVQGNTGTVVISI